MYKHLIILFLLSSQITAFSQNSGTIKVQKKGAKGLFIATKSPGGFLYKGIVNPVELVNKNICSNPAVVAVTGKAFQDKSNEKGKFVVKPSWKDTLILYLYNVKGKDSTLIGSQEFTVLNVPDPFPTIAGIGGGEITKDQLLNAGRLEMFYEGWDFQADSGQVRIASFDFGYSKGGMYYSFEHNGSDLSSRAIAEINDMEPGAKIIFENIKGIDHSGRARALPAIVLKLK